MKKSYVTVLCMVITLATDVITASTLSEFSEQGFDFQQWFGGESK